MNANPRTRLQRSRIVLALVSVIVLSGPSGVRTQSQQVANVLVVTMDGMRWQEVFGGVQKGLLTKEDGGVSDGRGDRSRASTRPRLSSDVKS